MLNYYIADMSPSQTVDCQSEKPNEAICSNNLPKTSSFFEGVEKLLEVWFSKGNSDFEDCDLRRIPR